MFFFNDSNSLLHMQNTRKMDAKLIYRQRMFSDKNAKYYGKEFRSSKSLEFQNLFSAQTFTKPETP